MKLFQDLHQQGVRYCHWKSNLRLDQALAGQTDLDLLVDRTQGALFRQVLAAHNVKPLVAAPGKEYMGVENYLGFDVDSGKLFHLHVHYQLVLGEQFVKNYRLPLESHLLDSVQLRQGVLVPAPAWELVILALRALLKYRDRDVIKDVLSIRQPGLPQHIRQEIHWLLAQTAPEQLAETLRLAADLLPTAAVAEFLQLVTVNPRAGREFYRLRSRVRRALRPYQRATRLQAAGAYLHALWRRSRWMRKFWPDRKMTPRVGGQTVALVGADGAGKSTVCRALSKWLAWKLDVHVYYLGSKQPSHRSRLIYLLFRGARRSRRTLCRALGEKNPLARTLLDLQQTLLCSHHLSIGYDRYRRYRASLKQAAHGSVIIYDRYPLAARLDGPKIHLMTETPTGAVRALAGREQRLYQRMRMPDQLLVLDVHPELSLQRKPDHDPAAIEAKSQIVQRLLQQSVDGSDPSRIVRIDANQPVDEVLHQLKIAVWQSL